MTTTTTPQRPDLVVPAQKDLYGESEALCQLVRLGQGRFTLALVEYDLPRTRADVIAHLRKEFSSLNIVEAQLSLPPPDAPLTFNVLDQLKNVVEAASPNRAPDVLICTGLETMFPLAVLTDDGQMSDELRRAIQPLNLGRNLLAEMFPCPVLLFLPKGPMEIVLTSAPDIVSWKSGFFVFESELQEVRAELVREAEVEIGWRARWRLRRLPSDALAHETRRLKAMLADARALPARRRIIAHLHNRLGWTALALGDGSESQRSFSELLRLARDIDDPKLIKEAERGLHRSGRLHVKRRKSRINTASRQQSFQGAAALSKSDGLFGREIELQELLLQILRVGSRFVIVWGETGCGKTSLVLAGVVQELEKQGNLSVLVREWEEPALALRTAIERKCGISLSASDSLRGWLQAASQKTDKQIVMIWDQFEQFFTKHTYRKDREPLLSEIGAALRDFGLPCKFIFMLREDFLGRMAELEKYVGDALDKNRRFYLRLFDQATALRVMRQLSSKADLNWPEVFLNEVIKDMTRDGQVRPIELQLVGAALVTLGINDEQAYSRAGRAEGLLTDYLQATLESVSRNRRELQDLKRILLALIGEPHERLLLSTEEIATQSRLHLNRTGDELQKLIGANLVLPTADPEENHVTDSTLLRYQLIHDVLEDPVLRLTRDIQDKRRRARKVLTRALEDLRVEPRHTVSLEEWSLLRSHLPAQLRAEPRVKSLMNRSLFFGRSQRMALALVASVAVLFLIQNAFVQISIERDFARRVVIRRGFLPSDFQTSANGILIDTGFTSGDIASRRLNPFESVFWKGEDRCSELISANAFIESLRSLTSQGILLCKIGRKVEGLSSLARALNRAPGSPYEFDTAVAIAALVQADSSLAKPEFDSALSLLKEDRQDREDRDAPLFGAGLVVEAAIKADPSLARPAFATLLSSCKDSKSSYPRWSVMNALVAAVKADPSLARPAIDTLLSIIEFPTARAREMSSDRSNGSSWVGAVFAAAIEADSSLAKPMFRTLLSKVKNEPHSLAVWSLGRALAAAVNADSSLAKPAFNTLRPILNEFFDDSAPVLAASIKADRSRAQPAFNTMVSLETKYGTPSVRSAATVFAAAIEADSSLAKPSLDSLLRVVETTREFDGLDAAFAAAFKAEPSLASPAFNALLKFQDKGDRPFSWPVAPCLAAAIKADPSLAKPAFDMLLAKIGERVSVPDFSYWNTTDVFRNCIVVNTEIRMRAASQLFASPSDSVRRGVISGFATYLARRATEEKKEGSDPVLFLLEHLEGKQSLMSNGNANTYAAYRQAVQGAMARWLISKTPEALATQAALRERLETMRDHETRLHLRIAAWDTLAAAADLRRAKERGDFEDIDE